MNHPILRPMLRRGFLGRSIALAALVARPGTAVAAGEVKRRAGTRIKVALNAYSFNRPLMAGEIPIELPRCSVVHEDGTDGTVVVRDETSTHVDGVGFDAAVVALGGDEPMAAIQTVAGRVRPGGWVVGTAPAARNRRRIEAFITTVLADDALPEAGPAGGLTRRALRLATTLDVGNFQARAVAEPAHKTTTFSHTA